MKFKKLASETWFQPLVLLLYFCFTASITNAQCSLACNGTTQVSLDENCEAKILPSTILNDQASSCPGGVFRVEIEDDYGLIPDYDGDGHHDVVGGEYCDKTLKARIIDTASGNVCWGYIAIEDKLGPIAVCPTNDIRLDCAAMNIYNGPEFADNCSGPVSPILLTESIETPCLPTIIKFITRTYTAVDAKGNTAADECTVRIRLIRLDKNKVKFPTNRLVADNTNLNCSGSIWDVNGNSYPDPEEVGVPRLVFGQTKATLDTLDLYPFPDVYCNTIVTFDDTVLPNIGCTQKIMRRWNLREWHCLGETDTTVVQIIEISDSEGPSITCGPNITITTNTLTGNSNSHYGNVGCASTVNLDLPTVTDNCSSNITFDVLYDGGFEAGYNGTTPITLPMGLSLVQFTAYDECYNSSNCNFHVNVVDNTPPVAVCDQYTVVSLTTGGEAVVNAHSFDDGSYDDCKEHCMLVRRMDAATCPCRIPEFCELSYLGNRNGSYYYLSNYDISATLAKSRATAYGGNLCFFDDAEEEAWVTGEVRKTHNGRFWVGAKRIGNSFHWDDHTAVNYTNWDISQPTLGPDEDCIMVTPNNKWNDASCLGEHKYVFEIKDICGFSQIANFCCSDVGTEQMVVFRVVDIFGNYNDCMVNVNVQDKLAPTLTCPDDTTVDCDEPYDINNLDHIFGTATVLDDCGANVSSAPVDEVNQCNVGRIVRVFTATDNAGRETTCKQVITFDNDDAFDGNDIVCPRDTSIIGCGAPSDLGPDILGYPTYPSDHCNLIGTDWDDDVYTFNNQNSDACLKILRNWEIVDWCQSDPSTGLFRKWYCHQVVKITNSEKPEIIRGCEPQQICVYDGDCIDGFIELEVEAQDDCTERENLRWRYEIHAGELGLGPANLNNPIAVEEGDGPIANATGKYPIGSHIIIWSFYDRCGNVRTCNQPFTIQNCKAPTAYCINGLAVDLMPMDVDLDGNVDFGMVELWASDFDAGSYHPCGLDVHLSFSADTADRNIVYDCTTFAAQVASGNNTPVEIWVSVRGPEGILIQTYCSTYIDVQDNTGACAGLRPDVSVDGNVYTEELEYVGNVEVSLDGSPLSAMTTDQGEYAFPNMPTGGAYTVNPYSNTDPLNGVTTLDLLVIQKHVLGVETIESPYKIIAADINKDNELTAIDLIELRQLILGIHNEFPNNDSWRFIDKDYQFLDPQLPLNEEFTEDYQINALNSDMHIDFIAVKVGDVNGTVEVGVNDTKVNGRNDKSISIQYDNIEVVAGDKIEIPFYSSQKEINGYQFNMQFDSEIVELVSISGANNFSASNYKLNNNNATFSWNSLTALKKGEEMFVAELVVKKSGDLSDAFEINTTEIKPEVYAVDGTIATPELSGNKLGQEIDQLVVYQNQPNPFSEQTEVRFNMPKTGMVNMSLLDIQGRMISTKSTEYSKGMNTVTFSVEDFGGAGIYYLSMKTDDSTETIKMVIVK